jgi:hypothetical protein
MCAEAAKSTHLLAHTAFPNCTRPSALPPVHLGHTQIDTLSSAFPTQTRLPWAHTNSTHPSTFPAHKFNPPDYLPRTQIEHLPPHKLNIFPHKNATHTTTLATQIRPPSPTKIDHIPHTKIDTPDHLSHTNSSTSPHKFEHLPRKKSTQLRAPSLTKN